MANGQTPALVLVGRLLAERGMDRWAPFLLQQEGKELPGAVESVSGFVLTDRDEVYGFWLDWDDTSGGFVLDPWYRVHDVGQFAGDVEYHRARQALGLGG